jgi:6-phosphogluconolactonase
MEFVAYPDREALMMGLAHRIGSELGQVLRATGRASLSVPGGTTPGPVFDMLSAAPLDWANVSVFLNDERWVPESSPRSNTALLRARLLQDKAAAATLIPMVSEAEAPEGALEALAAGIAPHLPISVLLLGMGADMHTASLFPGADRLAEGLAADAPLLLPMRAEAAGEPRITLTAPALTSAMHIHILITGPEKRAALERAVKLSPSEAPVALVLPHATIHWAE